MKKRLEVEDEVINRRELEIIKAVAQAWYSHGGSTRPLNEFDARKSSFRGKPSRFKLEAMKKKQSLANKNGSATSSWDFGQSLWDSYEIVTVSKRLETGLVLDSSFSELDNDSVRVHRRKSVKESKNSLRNLFNQMSSRRFNGANIPQNSDL